MIRKILITIGCVLLLVILIWFGWSQFGARAVSAQITRIEATWRRDPKDEAHETVENPLTPEELEAERQKLRDTP